MSSTDTVKVYQSKGASDTLAIVIPKKIRSSLNLYRGDKFQVTVDNSGNIVYKKKII